MYRAKAKEQSSGRIQILKNRAIRSKYSTRHSHNFALLTRYENILWIHRGRFVCRIIM